MAQLLQDLAMEDQVHGSDLRHFKDTLDRITAATLSWQRAAERNNTKLKRTAKALGRSKLLKTCGATAGTASIGGKF